MLNSNLESYLDLDVRPHWDNLEQVNADMPHQLSTLGGQPARQVINELGAELIGLLLESLEIATQTCTTVPIAPPGPDHYYSRKIFRKGRGIMAKRGIARKLRGLKENNDHDDFPATFTTEQDGDANTAERTAAGERVTTQMQEYMREHPEATQRGALMAVYDMHNRELAAINKADTKLTEQAKIRKQRALIDAKQSLGNKLATGKYQSTPKSALRILKTEQGTVTDPNRIKNIIHSYYKETYQRRKVE
jgi:hypothetical protein